MVPEETTKECSGIDLSCKKILTHGDAKNRGGGSEDDDNVVMFTRVFKEKCQNRRSPGPPQQVMSVGVVEKVSNQRSSMMENP